MAANTPVVNISTQAQENLRTYFRTCLNNVISTWNLRYRMRQIDLVYQRELDYTEEQLRAKTANRAGDPTKFQNVTVPIVLPAVESAVTYQSSVFLTGIPLFGVSASADKMDAALQLETIIDDQATKGGWIREIQLFLRDGFKYNLCAMEVEWAKEKTYTPTSNETSGAKSATKLEEVLWEGNRIKRLDLYNTIFDPRVIPAEISSKGEFAGYTELISKVELVKFLQSLEFRMNYQKAITENYANTGLAENSTYYIPLINTQALIDPTTTQQFNWFQWAGIAGGKQEFQFNNAYLKTIFYARIIPADHGLPATEPKKPQIWKFVFINGETLVYAERQTNAHDRLPILFAQPNEDGLGFQSKSLANNSAPFQEVASALMNSAIAARRRSVSDRGIYNPSLIDTKHINNDSATAKIPLKPAAYTRPGAMAEAYMPIPFRDEQSQQSMSDISSIMRFNEMVTGQNAAQQGQFVKGNKTLVEYQDIMGNANGRSQNTSILLESQFFTPLKELLKINVLQYQKPSQIYNRETETLIDIDPILLRTATLAFKMSDGLTPASKQMNTEAFQSACQTLAAVPQLAGSYNLGPMFSYLFKMQRADVAQFEKSPQQIAYEQAMQQWQAAVQQIVEALTKMKDVQYSPEDIQKALPPQPNPQQFGFDPANPKPPAPQLTVLQQLQQVQGQS